MIKFNKFSAFIVLVLVTLLFVPDLSNEIAASDLSITFLYNISITGFCLMLSALSFFWSYFSFVYGEKEFRARNLLGYILLLPLLIFLCFFIILALIKFSSSFVEVSHLAYRYIDIFVCFVFLLFIYRKFSKFLNLNSNKNVNSDLSVANNLLIAFFFAFYALAGLFRCVTFECRNSDLRAALGDEVYSTVEQYVKSSPLILQDLSSVKGIANLKGAKVLVNTWLDYSASMKLDVLGEKGSGTLVLSIAGNNYKTIEHIDGKWNFSGVITPIGFDGKKDESKIQFDKYERRTKELELLQKSNDCPRLIALINTNQEEVNAGAAYRFDHLITSKILAECYLQLKQTKKAALEFASYSFFIRPTPFQEVESDLTKLKESKSAILKAMELNPKYKYLHTWQLELEGIEIQESLALNSCDESLRNKLKENYAKRKVYYETMPPCVQAKS